MTMHTDRLPRPPLRAIHHVGDDGDGPFALLACGHATREGRGEHRRVCRRCFDEELAAEHALALDDGVDD